MLQIGGMAENRRFVIFGDFRPKALRGRGNLCCSENACFVANRAKSLIFPWEIPVANGDIMVTQ